MEGIGVDDLYWLDADGCEHAAFNTTLVDLDLYDIKVFDATSFFRNEAIMSKISKDTSSANKTGREHTQWTSRNLFANGFEMVDKNTICAVDDGEGRAFIVCIYTRAVNANTLTDFADYVLNTRGAVHKHVAGQVHCQQERLKEAGRAHANVRYSQSVWNQCHKRRSFTTLATRCISSKWQARRAIVYKTWGIGRAHVCFGEESHAYRGRCAARLFDHMDPKKRHRMTDE